MEKNKGQAYNQELRKQADDFINNNPATIVTMHLLGMKVRVDLADMM